MDQLKTEEHCGISCFLSGHDGFTCELKQRYQDFIVHEIDESGNVVKLTKLTADKPAKSEDIPEIHFLKTSSNYDSNDNNYMVDIETLLKLKQLNEGLITEVEIDCTALDKAQRTSIHVSIRETYADLESTTIPDNDGKVVINVKKTDKNTRKRKYWPADRGDYCKFVLYKENKDNSNVLAVVGKFLKMKTIGTAGTKDKRAVTSQLATVYRIEAETLASLNDKLIGIRLGNFRYCDKDLKLGALKGNSFIIILRNVTIPDDQIIACVELFKLTGFINYYGTQRFGTSSVPTHRIGRAVLQSNWSEVVDLILTERPDKPHLKECLSIWAETRDASLAYAALPKVKRDTCIEGMLLKQLKRHKPNEYVNAFKALPRIVKNLYVHSFQSLLWNKLASRRVEIFGQNLLLGDLISDNDDSKSIYNVTNANLHSVEITQLVLPFFAQLDCLPKNDIAEWYKELLAEENVSWENLQRGAKEFSLQGGHRRLFVKCPDVKYDIFSYNDPSDELTLTDLDELTGKALLPPINGGRYKALRIEFDLPSSCYATMALRELTKCDFEKQFQMSRINSNDDKTENGEKNEDADANKDNVDDDDLPDIVESIVAADDI